MSLPPNNDPLSPNRHPADPTAPDPVVNAGPTYNNHVERRSSGNGILIGAVVVVLAIVAYFVFVPTSNTPGTDSEPTAATEQSTTPAAPTATPAAPAAEAPAATPAPSGGATETPPAGGAAPAAPAQ